MPHERPKHTLISDHLLREIRQGDLPVGALIPTEAELMRSFGVSRNTVRTAIQSLKARGVVASRQGQGSKVISCEPAGAFVETIQSIHELITFGQETHRELLAKRTVKAGPELATKFGCEEGRLLAEAVMLRKTLDPDARAIAVVTLWMDVLIEPVIDGLSTIHKAAAEIVADQFGYEPKSVTQTVEADLLGESDALALDMPKGAPSLIIERRYHVEVDEVPYLIARSVCRADAIKLASSFVTSG